MCMQILILGSVQIHSNTLHTYTNTGVLLQLKMIMKNQALWHRPLAIPNIQEQIEAGELQV